ncbi:MAG: tetratricopeptide repeat protein [Terriglobia bacterium]
MLIITLLALLSAAAFAQKPVAALANVGNLLAQAKQAEEKHDFAGAATLYQEFLKTHPNQPGIMQRLGLVYYLSSRFDQAIPVFKRALKGDASLWGSDLFLGISYYRTGRFDLAEAPLRRALTLKPGLSEANFWLGSTLVAQHRPEAAIPYLRRAAPDAQLGVDADALLIRAYRSAAEIYFGRLSRLSPDSARVHQLKAQALEIQGNPAGALLEYQRALQRDPRVERVHRAMGELYWQERHFDLAAEQFTAELRVNPLDAESNLRIGEYRLAKGNAAEAIPFLQTALTAKTSEEAEAFHYLELAQKASR